MTRYTLEECGWASAEVWEWDGLDGTLIGTAVLSPTVHASVSVRFEDGTSLPRSYTDPADLLDAVEAHRKRLLTRGK